MARGWIEKVFPQRQYGFIRPEEGEEHVYFRFSHETGFEPKVGMIVEFDVEKGEKGLRAKNVRPGPDKSYRFLNPYNFVRFLNKPRPDRHVLGDCLPLPHDRYIGLSGRIVCEAKTLTPLFVSDTHAVTGDPNQSDHKVYRFFEVDGEPLLPGSSLRGMIRSVFETITNSCLGVFQEDERPMEYRVSNAVSMIPARVLEVNNGALLEKLDGYASCPWQRLPRLVSLAAAGPDAYPPQVKRRKGEQVISYDRDRSQLPPDARDGMRVAALIRLVQWGNGRGARSAYQAEHVVPAPAHDSLPRKSDCQKVFGWLHLTGPNIENKRYERVFFRWNDTAPEPPEPGSLPQSVLERVTWEVVEEYNKHLEGYWDRLGDKVEQLEKHNRRWPSPTADLPQPSMFVKKDSRLCPGDLVYIVKWEEKTYLRPVSMPRLPYRHTRQSLLPPHVRHCTKPEKLCPACRMFGWVSGDEAEDVLPMGSWTAYTGRVRVSDGAQVQRGSRWPQERTTLGILSAPKPSATPFYLLASDGRPDPLITYDTGDARLRGRKFYRRHRSLSDEAFRFIEPDSQNRTVRNVVDKGAVFCFVVEFENLAPLELGALLYALELEEGMAHRLGYGKPFGFGSVTLSIVHLELIDWEKRLVSLQPDAGLELQRRSFIEECKERFRTEMQAWYGDEFDAMMSDLRALLKEPPEELPIHYPRPTRRWNPDHPSYEWFVGNKKRIYHEQKKLREKEGGRMNGKQLPPPVALDLADGDRGLPLIGRDGREGEK